VTVKVRLDFLWSIKLLNNNLIIDQLAKCFLTKRLRTFGYKSFGQKPFAQQTFDWQPLYERKTFCQTNVF
jgi:hypothetical protein